MSFTTRATYAIAIRWARATAALAIMAGTSAFACNGNTQTGACSCGAQETCCEGSCLAPGGTCGVVSDTPAMDAGRNDAGALDATAKDAVTNDAKTWDASSKADATAPNDGGTYDASVATDATGGLCDSGAAAYCIDIDGGGSGIYSCDGHASSPCAGVQASCHTFTLNGQLTAACFEAGEAPCVLTLDASTAWICQANVLVGPCESGGVAGGMMVGEQYSSDCTNAGGFDGGTCVVGDGGIAKCISPSIVACTPSTFVSSCVDDATILMCSGYDDSDGTTYASPCATLSGEGARCVLGLNPATPGAICVPADATPAANPSAPLKGQCVDATTYTITTDGWTWELPCGQVSGFGPGGMPRTGQGYCQVTPDTEGCVFMDQLNPCDVATYTPTCVATVVGGPLSAVQTCYPQGDGAGALYVTDCPDSVCSDGACQ